MNWFLGEPLTDFSSTSSSLSLTWLFRASFSWLALPEFRCLTLLTTTILIAYKPVSLPPVCPFRRPYQQMASSIISVDPVAYLGYVEWLWTLWPASASSSALWCLPPNSPWDKWQIQTCCHPRSLSQVPIPPRILTLHPVLHFMLLLLLLGTQFKVISCHKKLSVNGHFFLLLQAITNQLPQLAPQNCDPGWVQRFATLGHIWARKTSVCWAWHKRIFAVMSTDSMQQTGSPETISDWDTCLVWPPLKWSGTPQKRKIPTTVWTAKSPLSTSHKSVIQPGALQLPSSPTMFHQLTLSAWPCGREVCDTEFPCLPLHHCPRRHLSTLPASPFVTIHTQLSYQAFGNSKIGLPFSRHFLYPGLCKYLIKENKLKIIHGAIKYSTMTVVINTAVLIWKLLGENRKSCHHKERKICNYGGADRC